SVWACAIFSDVDFSGADLTSGRFEYSQFNRCTFDDQTDLTNATLFEADLATSTLPPEVLAKAHGDDSTTLPDGMDRPAAWPSPRPTAP
ncbi:MAG: pentapeptide repeat-containing protein, partial [Gemmobacter sp.]